MLEDKDWRVLVRQVLHGQVIPVVGPALVTINDPASGNTIPLNRHLAWKLAAALHLETAEALGCANLNDVARAHLLRGGRRKDLYEELRHLIDSLDVPLSPALVELAGIKDFDLYISSTPDPLLSLALEQERPSFLAKDRNRVLAFHPNHPEDLPDALPNPLLYAILGDYNTYPDFAVWEEDYMEFICGLLKHSDTLKNLFRALRNRYLLLLGAPSEDWIVRFFLRVARQRRLSDCDQRDYLADSPENLGAPMIFYFDRVVGATWIIQGDPGAFVCELARRWREQCGAASNPKEFLDQIPEEMPPNAVFISYASENLAAACCLAQSLIINRVPVWLDKQRLRAGENFEHSLEQAVKDCSFFVSLISAATESDPDGYFHKERNWAAERYTDGFVFYIPVIIDNCTDPQREPPCFSRIQRMKLLDGRVTPEFARRVHQLVVDYRQAGRPRG